MKYLLNWWLINGKSVWKIITLQEFDLDFSTPKSKKVLILTKFIANFSSNIKDPLLIDNFLDDQLFLISCADPWYKYILTYFCIKKFLHISLGMITSVSFTKPPSISLLETFYIFSDSIQSCIKVSHLRRMSGSLVISIVVHI